MVREFEGEKLLDSWFWFVARVDVNFPPMSSLTAVLNRNLSIIATSPEEWPTSASLGRGYSLASTAKLLIV